MAKKDHWIPACGGTETVFTVNGRRWQYCWNPAKDQHRYLDVDADRIIEDRHFHPAHAPEREFYEPPQAPASTAPIEDQCLSEVYYF